MKPNVTYTATIIDSLTRDFDELTKICECRLVSIQQKYARHFCNSCPGQLRALQKMTAAVIAVSNKMRVVSGGLVLDGLLQDALEARFCHGLKTAIIIVHQHFIRVGLVRVRGEFA